MTGGPYGKIVNEYIVTAEKKARDPPGGPGPARDDRVRADTLS